MKCGIVGCGGIARLHTQAIQEMDDCQLVAVADCKIENAKSLISEYGLNSCYTYQSLEDMIQNSEIEVLHICTPHYLHVPMAIYAMQHGIHVFMEKPPAISREQFRLLEAAQNDTKLGICFQNRYNMSVKAVKEMLKDPSTGDLRGARAFVTWNRTEEYYTESGWRGTWIEEGGGALINQSIHTLDLLVQLIGKPIWTEASMHNHHLKNIIEVEDTLEAYIQFEKGPVCFYATTANSCNSPVIIELDCENVTIRIEDLEVTCIYRDGHKKSTNFYKEDTIGKDYWGNGHKACIEDYYDCLKTGKSFLNRLDNVKDTFLLTMDVYQSAKEKKVITFQNVVKLSGFADEIDTDFDIQLKVLRECNISYMDLRSAYGINISEYSLEDAKKLKLKLDQNHIKVSSIGSPIGKISITEDFSEHLKLFYHVVSLAKLFHTKYIRIFSFYIPEDMIPESYKRIVIERLKIMIAYAKEKGIILLHENEKGIYGDTICRCEELMNELYSDNFKAVFDFANFIQCNQDTLEAFHILRPFIEYIHVKDAFNQEHQIVPAGIGIGHISEIVTILQNDNYNGFYSLEPYLTEFVGLQQLERDNCRTNVAGDITNGRDSFLIAYDAFTEILKQIV